VNLMHIDILFFAALFLIEATLCARVALRGTQRPLPVTTTKCDLQGIDARNRRFARRR
jgi:hypothetical protein